MGGRGVDDAMTVVTTRKEGGRMGCSRVWVFHERETRWVTIGCTGCSVVVRRGLASVASKEWSSDDAMTGDATTWSKVVVKLAQGVLGQFNGRIGRAMKVT